jgi:rhamnosyl/mannosyltransferase
MAEPYPEPVETRFLPWKPGFWTVEETRFPGQKPGFRTTPLRVVHLGKYYPPASGGIETHTRTLARAQADLGADVRVVVVNHADRAGRDVTFEGLTPTPAAEDADGPVRVLRAGRWGQLAKLDLAPGLAGLLRRVLRDPPDVWHLHAPNVTMMLAILTMPRIRPLVVTHHSDIVRQRVLKYAVRPLEVAVYRRAARLLPTSPAYVGGSDVLKRFPGKVEPLPLGLDLTPFTQPSAAALGHAERFRRQHPGPIWVSVGRLIYYKALDVALAALRDVPGTLLVIGTGPMEAAWRKRAEELKVADRVAWLGRSGDDELVGAYLAATALWFPSTARSEGFGLVQVEAMASGCPVVNAAIPDSGVAWVCRHGEAGLTVPVNDPAAFAAASRRLVDEPGLRTQLGAEARRQAVERFDHRTMAAHSLAIYRAAVGGDR